jgi:hypothetical protein
MLAKLRLQSSLSPEQQLLKRELEVLDSLLDPGDREAKAVTEGLEKRGYSVMGPAPDSGVCPQCGKPW